MGGNGNWIKKSDGIGTKMSGTGNGSGNCYKEADKVYK